VPNSLEKLEQLHREFVTTPPPPDAGGAELALRTLLVTAGPMLREQLPTSAGDLDDLLERGATFMLAMRSDDSVPLVLAQDDDAGELEPAAARDRDPHDPLDWPVEDPDAD
jgi:hypothetical protein